MEWIFDPQSWIALFTLSVLEIVLGIDNLVFISVLSSKLPKSQQKMARRFGLLVAMLTRLPLLTALVWIAGLVNPLFTLFDHVFSGRDLLLIIGGMFLLLKGVHEIHETLERKEVSQAKAGLGHLSMILVQIALFDIIFSLDSVITAVGMVDHYLIMAIAIVISVLVMLLASEPLHRFIHQHVTVKILAWSFLLLVGMVLVADGFGLNIPREYVYFAIIFSIFVEGLNIAARKRQAKKRQ